MRHAFRPQAISSPESRTLGRRPFSARCLLLILAFGFALPGLASAQYSTATHFPLAEGMSWEYIENGTVTVFKDVLVGLENVNGVDTFVIETNGGEVGFGQERFTNDAAGLEFHRASDAGGSGTFVPPAVLLPDQLIVGQSIQSSGQVEIAPGFSFLYSTSSTVIGPATITVPAGTFDTVLVEVTISINGMPTTDRLYLADGVGVVRGEANIFSGGGVTELVAVPEAGFVPALASSLALVGALGRRKSRARSGRA